MNCRYCGSSLRVGALFCGECGRSVNGERSLRGPSEPGGATEEVTPIPVEDSGLPSPLERSTSLLRCPQCSAVALSTDVFCRECGFVVGAAEVPSARDTVAVEGDLVPPTSDSSEAAAGLDAVPAPWPEQREEPKADGDAEPVDDSVPVPDTASESDVEPDSEPDAEPDIDPERDASPEAERDAEVDESSSAAAGLDLAPRRDPAAAGTGERFVLQFSTGESVTVAGSGLIGRNPVAQPGEFVDQLIVVSDPAKTVSKTHLEFGQEEGVFWVSDRYATNGSVVRPPDRDPWRCEAGRRYRIERGSRVDIGDQFFVVS